MKNQQCQKIYEASCDKCEQLLSDSAGWMTSMKELETNIKIFNWFHSKEKGITLCYNCKKNENID